MKWKKININTNDINENNDNDNTNNYVINNEDDNIIINDSYDIIKRRRQWINKGRILKTIIVINQWNNKIIKTIIMQRIILMIPIMTITI